MTTKQVQTQKGAQSAQPASVQARRAQPAPLGRVALQRAMADPAAAAPGALLALQRQAGNRAVQRLLGARPLQAKLTVGPAGDQYEQEADRVADQVTRMPGAVQRSGAEDEEEIQTKPLAAGISRLVQRSGAEDEEEIQTKASDPRAGFEAGGEIEAQLQAQRGGGQPLPVNVRQTMEPRFGADFSGVRLHADSQATQLNRALSAQAFTHGRDIYVDEGRYHPGDAAGQHLLAHELTHVVQQTGAVQRVPDIQRGLGDWLKQRKHKSRVAQYTDIKDKIASDKTGEPKAGAFKVSISLTAFAETRSRGTMKENGHSWVEILPTDDWATTATSKEGQAIRSTRPATAENFDKHGWTSIGFYPGKQGSMAILAVPGKIFEPEKGVMLANPTATKRFNASADQVRKLLAYANSKESGLYSFIFFNCTNFAVGALGAAGLPASEFLGKTSSKGVTSPNKVYKRLFERAALGDKSVRIVKDLFQTPEGGGEKRHIEDTDAEALSEVLGGKKNLTEGANEMFRTRAFGRVNGVLLEYKKNNKQVSMLELKRAGKVLETDNADMTPDERGIIKAVYAKTITPDSVVIAQEKAQHEAREAREAVQLEVYSDKDGPVAATLNAQEVQPGDLTLEDDQDPANGDDWVDIVYARGMGGPAPYKAKKAEYQAFVAKLGKA